MKKFLSMFAIVAAMFAVVGCEKNDEVVLAENLPREVTIFVQTHFPGVEILNVIKDYSGRKAYDFEIRLDDGTRLEISKGGEWKDVENYKKGVPSSIIPAEILAYVVDNHPEAIVISIDRERGFEVGLNVGVDIYFDQSGNFSRYDY
jgi:hypothetical protein